MRQQTRQFLKAWLSFCVLALLARVAFKVLCVSSNVAIMFALAGIPKDTALHISAVFEGLLTFTIAFFVFRWTVSRFLLREAIGGTQ